MNLHKYKITNTNAILVWTLLDLCLQLLHLHPGRRLDNIHFRRNPIYIHYTLIYFAK